MAERSDREVLLPQEAVRALPLVPEPLPGLEVEGEELPDRDLLLDRDPAVILGMEHVADERGEGAEAGLQGTALGLRERVRPVPDRPRRRLLRLERQHGRADRDRADGHPPQEPESHQTSQPHTSGNEAYYTSYAEVNW